MPKQKDLKRLVRSRMQKTGESYTAARTQLLKKKTSSAPPPPEPIRRAGMSDDALRLKTGRNWKEWVVVLDRAGAATLPHRDIARMVHEKHGLTAWWSQCVTVGYERIKGLREIGQRRSGGWEASKSRTFPVPVEKLVRAFGIRGRRVWLPGIDVKVRKAGDKSLRLTWPDATSVQIEFLNKGKAKSQVTIQHSGLTGKEDLAERKAFWSSRLDDLADHLTGERRADE